MIYPVNFYKVKGCPKRNPINYILESKNEQRVYGKFNR